MFTQLRGRRVKNRIMKTTVVPDIYSIGLSIVNKKPVKDLEKVFVDDSVTSGADTTLVDGDQSDSRLADILSVISDLQLKVTTLQNENKTLFTMMKSMGRCGCDSNRNYMVPVQHNLVSAVCIVWSWLQYTMFAGHG